MHRFHRSHIRVRQQGQTLIIALIVMGVLLILGLVFLGLINRNILNAARSQRRSESEDLAVAGVTYAHSQLLQSPQGADWRGSPSTLGQLAADVTGDPDVYYLRPGSGLLLPNTTQADLGGPDGLGPFIRVPFSGGRALVRVRYGASDASLATLANGPLRSPGAARSTLIIESVGRTGVVNPNDPTTLNQTGGVKFQNYANVGELQQRLADMARASSQLATSRRVVAFAPIGIIDSARFETNVFNSSAPIELGVADGLGIQAYNDGGSNGTDVGSKLHMQLGSSEGIRGLGQYGGSVQVNGDLRIYGNLDVYLNRLLGDGVRVSGRITGANGASLNVYQGGTLLQSLDDVSGNPSFDSQYPSFSTAGGLVLDGSPRTDAAGFPSGVGALAPPSTLTVDPDTKLNRYVSMTRETGTVSPGGASSGAFGHGEGVYVDNAADRQEATDAQGRKAVGSERSLIDDLLQPNSGSPISGWKGPFYIPPAAVVQLLPDGFSVQRDGAGAARTWKRPDGTDSGASTIRYRLGRGTGGEVRIVDTLTTGIADINGTLAAADFDKGLAFNGVLYFEGNARVRGTIPTGVQMTLVSGATIYIDGSILKGTTNTEITGGTRDQSIDGLPTASLMLMAKDNVVVNTTMFTGPTASQAVESVNDVSGATGISPVRIRSAGGPDNGQLDLVTELALDPKDPTSGNLLTNASLWRPYVLRYKPFDSNTSLSTQLLVKHTMDDGTAAASFLAMDVNFGSGASQYAFDAVDPDGLLTNTAATYTGQGSGTMSIYGLGAEPWQRYSRFETRGFTLVPSPDTKTYSNTGQISGTGMNPMYSGGNNVLLRPGAIAGVSTNDLLVGGATLLPGDVRIEASVFAEQGSFLVVPGPWFNPNPNDTHSAYAARVAALQQAPPTGAGLTLVDATARANRERLENYGTAPAAPFFAEPLDVKVNIVGSVAENLPPPIAVQSEWVRKWGWIPRRLGGTGIGIPKQHLNPAFDAAKDNFVPNLVIQYDPILATGRLNDPTRPEVIRTDSFGRPLPPMPRLPVSPKLAYFGEL